MMCVDEFRSGTALGNRVLQFTVYSSFIGTHKEYARADVLN